VINQSKTQTPGQVWWLKPIRFEARLGKKFMRFHLNQQLLAVARACHPSYKGSTNRRMSIQAALGTK
jgi:hypothetical protein